MYRLYFLPFLQFTTPSPSSTFILCIVSLGIKSTSLIMTRGLHVWLVAIFLNLFLPRFTTSLN